MVYSLPEVEIDMRAIVALSIAGVVALVSLRAATGQTLQGPAGPYPVVMEIDPTLPGHTVYRPQDLSKVKGPVPFVAWGNGACMNVGGSYRTLLGELASHGYVVTAPGPIERPAQASGGIASNQSKPGQMLEAIDWAGREAKRPGSRYRGRLDPSQIAVAGHSCGGLEAIAAGKDPRVDTVMVFNSGIIRGAIVNADGTTRQPAGYLPAGEADLPKLRQPVLYLTGGPSDQAQRGADADFEQIRHVPVFSAFNAAGHGGTWREPAGGAMGRAAPSWLNWRLKGDEMAGRTFLNPNCGLCTDPAWTVRKRNMG